MKSSRCLDCLTVAALIALGCGTQRSPESGLASQHDHRLMECNDNDLATKRVGSFSSASLFWHITRFPSGPAAEAGAHGPADFVVTAENQVWLYSFGPKEDVPNGGIPVAQVGPLRLVPARGYQIAAYR